MPRGAQILGTCLVTDRHRRSRSFLFDHNQDLLSSQPNTPYDKITLKRHWASREYSLKILKNALKKFPYPRNQTFRTQEPQ
jgi:hypothetical protein